MKSRLSRSSFGLTDIDNRSQPSIDNRTNVFPGPVYSARPIDIAGTGMWKFVIRRRLTEPEPH